MPTPAGIADAWPTKLTNVCQSKTIQQWVYIASQTGITLVLFHSPTLSSLRKLLKMIIRGVDASAELLLRGWGGYIIGSHLLSGHQSPLRTRTTVLRCRRGHLIIGLLLHVKLPQKYMKISYNTRGRKASIRNGI